MVARIDPVGELRIERIFDAPPAEVFEAWTKADVLKQWFAPQPWTVVKAELDVRPGGTSLIVMSDGQGNDFPTRGVYLEVVENERIVFTDAYMDAWTPSAKPFATIIVSFEDLGGRTHYTARARHWSDADRSMHRNMGFEAGWKQCADQLATLLAQRGHTP
jgi:uncharacterized protein YndB with AHSA1/START domain